MNKHSTMDFWRLKKPVFISPHILRHHWCEKCFSKHLTSMLESIHSPYISLMTKLSRFLPSLMILYYMTNLLPQNSYSEQCMWRFLEKDTWRQKCCMMSNKLTGNAGISWLFWNRREISCFVTREDAFS